MWYQGLSNIQNSLIIYKSKKTKDNLTTQYNLTPSGFWIDMNEYSNFVNGEIPENGSCNNGFAM
jgi:hypothetical protein